MRVMAAPFAARWTLRVLLAFTLLGAGLSIHRLATDPLWAPLVSRSEAEIRAAIDRMMAEEATPEAVAARIEARLGEQPRNWIALDALQDLAVERGIALPPELVARLDQIRAEDHGFMAEAVRCAACSWDVAACALDQVLVCYAPVAMTPVADIAGISRAGMAWASGTEIDEVDLALSVAGLGATAAILASGGSSATVKAGAGLLRMARGMGRLSPRLAGMVLDTARTGVDWARLPGVRSVDDLRGAIRTERFGALMSTADDLYAVRTATDMTTALHLLPLVDGAGDARRLAVASKALGPKVVGRAEVLGKGRLFRATLSWTNAGLQFIASIGAFAIAFALLLAQGLQHLLLQPLRRQLRRAARG